MASIKLSSEQSRLIGFAIYSDIKSYITQHSEQFAEFVNKENESTLDTNTSKSA